MNILFIIPSFEIGGAQSFLFKLASDLSQKNDVILFNIHPKKIDEEYCRELISPNVKIYALKSEAIEKFIEIHFHRLFARNIKRILHKLNFFNIINQTQLKYIIKKYNIEIINSHMYLADLFVYRNRGIIPRRVKWFSSFHGCYNLLLDDNKNKNIFNQFRSIIIRTNGIIVAADKHLEVFTKLSIKVKNIKKIYYGFKANSYKKYDLRKAYNLPEDAFIFGMVARGDKTKGWEEAVKAFAALPLNDKVFLFLIGNGTYLRELRKQYKEYRNIVIVGPTNCPLREIENFDVGLLPTYYPAESLPNSIIEYLYCRKPVIATDWAEIHNMLSTEDGLAGQLIPIVSNKPDVNRLKEAMLNYIKDPNLLNLHKKRTALAFKKFSMKKCSDLYLGFFKDGHE